MGALRRVDQFRNFLGSLGTQRLLMMVGVAAFVIVALAYLAVSGRGGPMTYLYTDLDPAGARTITERLKTDGVPYQLSADGNAVLVPEDRVADLRMAFAGEQLGGSLGYEILDREDAFGTSAAKAKINRTRAIEGELARSIETINAVGKARVHIVIPERQLFSEEQPEASASVQLRTNGKLATGQVDAIRYLVASAVPGLAPERISVVDQTGALLARAGDGSGSSSGNAALEERQANLQARLREQIETMLGAIVGPGHVRAEVAAELDLDQMRQESETYDPDLQVVAKTTTVEKEDQDSEANQEGGFVSAANALPENAPSEQGRDTRSSSASEISEETLYANSSTKTTLVRGGGQVKRLTVSVMVDGSYLEAAGGRLDYRPRTQAELERFTRLVENAIGYDEARGDSVIVENLRFAQNEDTGATALGVPLGIDREDIVPLAKTTILGLVGIGALALVLRALGKSGAPGTGLPVPAGRPANDIDGRRIAELIERAANGDEDAIDELKRLRERFTARDYDDAVDVANVDGRVRQSSLQRIGNVVQSRPGEATAIVRQWMYS
jgi:flagellar M-ring protein FliF